MTSQDTSLHTLLLVATQNLVTWSAYIVSHLLDGLQWSSARFPNATRVVEVVVIAYFVWRSYVRIMRFWWRLCIFLLKMGLFYLTGIVLLGVYLRGLETFIFQDTYKIWSVVRYLYDSRKDRSTDHITYVDPLQEENPIMKAASSFLSNNKNAIDSMEDKFYAVKTHAEEYLKEENLESNLKNVYGFAANLGLF